MTAPVPNSHIRLDQLIIELFVGAMVTVGALAALGSSSAAGSIILWILASFGLLAAVQLGYGYVVYRRLGSWAERGAFGDMFGGLNTLFSGLAFLGVIVAVLLQRRELELQREELGLTREELKRTADAQQESIALLAEEVGIRRSLAQPVFAFRGSSYDARSSHRVVMFNNVGTTATNLLVTPIVGDFGIKVSPADVLTSDGEGRFFFVHDQEATGEWSFKIEYLDSLGEQNERAYKYDPQSGQFAEQKDDLAQG